MASNFFLHAFRNMRKHSGYLILNLVGLTIGLTSFILVSLYVINELTYDRFNKNHKNTYRIKVVGMMSGASMDQAVTAAPMAAALKNDYPEIEHVVRLNRSGAWIVKYNDIVYNEDGILFADSTFFSVFDYKLLRGDRATALVNPKTIIVTEEYAAKYFGREDPLGKRLSLESDTNLYTITGVMENIPSNSHLQFDMLGSLNSFRGADRTEWLSHNYYTYVVFADGTKPEAFEPKFNEVLLKYVGPQVKQIIGITIEDFQKAGNQFGYRLEPLADIHLKGAIQYPLEPPGSLTNVYIFAVIAFLILIIAIINYINLATAKSAGRAREVGIRKVSGSGKPGLMTQFIGESLIIVAVSAILASLLVAIILPVFNNIIGKEISGGLLSVSQWILAVGGLIFFVGVGAGFYPAFVLASFNPVEVLKGTMSPGSVSKTLRGILVVFQFTISVIIIIGAFVVHNQLNFMTSADIGIDKENLLVIRRSDLLKNRIDAFKQELLNINGVVSTGNSNSIPGTDFSNNAFFLDQDPSKNTYLIQQAYVSVGFAEALGVKLKEGRFLSKDYGTDSSAVMINETAVRSLGLKDPVGKYLLQPGREGEFDRYRIVGIMKDFNIKSLHNKVEPVCLTFMRGNFEGYLIVRLSGTDMQTAIRAIENKWNEYVGNQPFQYEFFDEGYERLYESEFKAGRIFIFFAVLAIIIACLGLIGLNTYMTTIRTREIGIRKTFGSSGNQVVILFSKEVVMLIVLSSLVAYPVAWYGLTRWLEGFATRVSINPLLFLAASLIGFALGWISIFYQTMKAASSNPAEALRYK